ncbi:PemK-like protein [Desulfitobacterium dichloroeliminans LMG P-21439]|uniref:PemK-like protein n=2 Tax=Desulfitobacterium dichloroeliminans TaxID=233055 RepID=L0FAP2_DESDL|nr:PemK-like protein [Desulfitobacterium dichloroeliminans LMG P-21439]
MIRMDFNVGDIFWLDVEFEDDPDSSKRRPAIIVGGNADELFILVSTTSQPPSNPPSYHDQFKIPILNWRNNGFTKPSWVKGLFLLRYSNEYLVSVVKPDDYIIKMDENSFNYLVSELELIYGRND